MPSQSHLGMYDTFYSQERHPQLVRGLSAARIIRLGEAV